MVRCSPLDQSLLEKTKLSKALVKLVKRGPDQIGSLAQSVLDAAAKNSKERLSEDKTAKSTDSAKNIAVKQAQISRTPETTTLKRPRDSEALSKKGSSGPTIKSSAQTATSRTSSLPANKLGSPASKVGSTLKNEAKSVTPSISNGVSAPKIKHVATKPSSIFATLQSASKKPGTSNAAQKAVQAGEIKSK